MPENQKQNTIKVRNVTGDQISFLSRVSGQSKTQFLADVIDALFTIACTYNSLNINYDFVITESKVTIQCEGKSNLEVNEVKAPTAKEESRFSPIIKQKIGNEYVEVKEGEN